MAPKLPYPNYLTKHYYIIHIIKLKVNMKHRTHKDFPSYRFYSDNRILNKTTNHFIKVKPKMKLIDAHGKRCSVNSLKLFAQLFPNLYTWEPYKALRTKAIVHNRKRRKYNPKFIKAIQNEANHKTWDELVKEYNIPIGSIGYLLKKGKGNPNGQIIININRVIIRK